MSAPGAVGTPAAAPLHPATAARLAARVAGASGALHAVRCPWDGAVVAEVRWHEADDIAAVERRARAAQRAWARVPMGERIRIVRRFARLVLERRAELLDVIQSETGKSRVHALEEVLDVARFATENARIARGVMRPKRHLGALPVLTSTREVRHPKGVVGVIAPWNYPFTLTASDSVPALLAGNAVVLKPDTQTPLSALAVQEMLVEAGLPADLLQVVIGPGPLIGGAVVDIADFVMFTGSTATGTSIAQRCALRLIPFSGELGGKNPLIVLSDADVEAAARGAVRASFSNAGQLCVSTERVYVPREIADAFTAAFVRETRKLRVGTGADWRIDVGSLISERQRDAVQAHVDDAVAQGATVLTGGHPLPEVGPTAYAPTILVDVPDTAILHRQETFGPVVAIYPVADDEEAIARANDSDYGLNASIWTTRSDALGVARRVQAGTVNINEGYAAAWASHGAPMGGWKSSGLGRRHGREGLEKYTQSQTVSRQRLRPIGPWPGMANETYERLMAVAVGVLNRLR